MANTLLPKTLHEAALPKCKVEERACHGIAIFFAREYVSRNRFHMRRLVDHVRQNIRTSHEERTRASDDLSQRKVPSDLASSQSIFPSNAFELSCSNIS